MYAIKKNYLLVKFTKDMQTFLFRGKTPVVQEVELSFMFWIFINLNLQTKPNN